MSIEIEAISEKKLLLDNLDTVILSTIDESGMPNSSYAPIALDENGYIYIYISELAKHTDNIIANKKVSVMFIEDESKAANLYARKRLTINVIPEHIDRDTEDWNRKMIILENKFSETIKALKNMTDFHLFRLKPKDALLVYGFGKAFRFKGEDLAQLSHVNEKGHKEAPISLD